MTMDQLRKALGEERFNAVMKAKEDAHRRLDAHLQQKEDERRVAEFNERNSETKAYTTFKTRMDTLNKTELRFFNDFLQSESGVIVQPTRMFELQGGGTYTPDFVLPTERGLEVYEVKGHYRGPGWDQGIERYKRAAAQWAGDYVHFWLYEWERKNNRWRCEEWQMK